MEIKQDFVSIIIKVWYLIIRVKRIYMILEIHLWLLFILCKAGANYVYEKGNTLGPAYNEYGYYEHPASIYFQIHTFKH